MGGGAVYGTSTRQKINTTSSTEAETVGIHEVLPQILWTRYFLEAQGFGVEDSIIYQDNQSSILLAKNGRGSSSKRTRHINIRYFFVADRIASKEVKVEYCPTGDMVADYFTKPLQGTLFKKFRDFIMNFDSSPNLEAAKLSNTMTNRRSVLEHADPNKVMDGPCFNKDNDMDGPCFNKDNDEKQDTATGQAEINPWSIVDHRKDKARRHRLMSKKILRKRTSE